MGVHTPHTGPLWVVWRRHHQRLRPNQYCMVRCSSCWWLSLSRALLVTCHYDPNKTSTSNVVRRIFGGYLKRGIESHCSALPPTTRLPGGSRGIRFRTLHRRANRMLFGNINWSAFVVDILRSRMVVGGFQYRQTSSDNVRVEHVVGHRGRPILSGRLLALAAKYDLLKYDWSILRLDFLTQVLPRPATQRPNPRCM